MRTITLEEHFATPGFLDGPGRDLREQARQVGSRAEQLMRDLCDMGEGRIAQMDAAGIDMQVLSLSAPGIEQLEAALLRIQNKTYGICRGTGKLIPAERLRAVPHTTMSMEAKLKQA